MKRWLPFVSFLCLAGCGGSEQVSAPKIHPESGTYDHQLAVVMVSETAGAQIFYTTDGTEPSRASSRYTDSLLVAGHGTRMTVKALAVNEGMADSEITSREYVLNYADAVGTPTFSIEPGRYTTPQVVHLWCNGSFGTIRYTLDGTDPSPTNGLTYEPGADIAVPMNSTVTIKAYAFAYNKIDSAVVTGTFSVYEKVATPGFAETHPGTYTTARQVQLTCNTPGAVIRYTTDGSAPTATNGSTYEAPVDLPMGTTTFSAYAYLENMYDSDLLTGTFTRVETVAAPTFSTVQPGTYSTPQSVALDCTTPGAIVRYTTDGSTPTSTSLLYTGTPISVPAGTTKTIKAYASLAGWADSAMLSGTFTVVVPVTGVTLSTSALTLRRNDTATLVKTISPVNATNQTVTWSSSDTNVATVSAAGVVTAKAAGAATITVTTQDGARTASCLVTVTVPVSSVWLDWSSQSLLIGGSKTLVATVSPSDATDKSLTWSSSDSAVATVSSAGTVAALKAGSATITATTTDGAKTAQCQVTVYSTQSPPATVNATKGTTTGSIRVSWSAAAGATGYTIYRSPTSQGAPSPLATVGSAFTYYDDTPPIDGTYYYYWVAASNASGEGLRSSSYAYGLTKLRAPTNLYATTNQWGTIGLSWSCVNGAIGYEVYRDGTLYNTYYDLVGCSVGTSALNHTSHTFYVVALGMLPAANSAPSATVTGYAN